MTTTSIDAGRRGPVDRISHFIAQRLANPGKRRTNWSNLLLSGLALAVSVNAYNRKSYYQSQLDDVRRERDQFKFEAQDARATALRAEERLDLIKKRLEDDGGPGAGILWRLSTGDAKWQAYVKEVFSVREVEKNTGSAPPPMI